MMNTRILAPALLAVLLSAAAMAGINTAKPLGPLDLLIYPDGTGEMINNGAVAFGFDGYTIESVAVVFDVEKITGICGGWFDDWYGLTWWPDPPCGWTPMSATPDNWSEVAWDKVFTLQPGGSVDLGPGFPGLTQANGTFTYVDSTMPVGQTSFEGAVIVVPEPAAMSLILAAGLPLMLTRKRSAR